MTGTWGDSIERNNDKTRGYYCYMYIVLCKCWPARISSVESADAATHSPLSLLSRCNKLYLLLLFKIQIGADRAPNTVFV